MNTAQLLIEVQAMGQPAMDALLELLNKSYENGRADGVIDHQDEYQPEPPPPMTWNDVTRKVHVQSLQKP